MLYFHQVVLEGAFCPLSYHNEWFYQRGNSGWEVDRLIRWHVVPSRTVENQDLWENNSATASAWPFFVTKSHLGRGTYNIPLCLLVPEEWSKNKSNSWRKYPLPLALLDYGCFQPVFSKIVLPTCNCLVATNDFSHIFLYNQWVKSSPS